MQKIDPRVDRYYCSCCREPFGISHRYCPECKAGNCHRAEEERKKKDMARQPRRRLQLEEPVIPQLAVHIVLDMSSSMSTLRSETIAGVNSYIEDLKRDNPTAIVSLTLFSNASNINTVWQNLPVQSVEGLSEATYCPSGFTALYDAIGRAIGYLETVKVPNKVLVILTDGQENCSRVYSKGLIRNSILEHQESHNWLITYLGANQDAFEEGGQIGVSAARSMNFSYNGGGMRSAFASASASTARYSATQSIDEAAYTSSERTSAVEDDTGA